MVEQLDLFSNVIPTFKINKPIRLIELFAGIGSQAKALENLGVEFEHWFVCEFDKHAIDSYNAIHGTNFETSDITKVQSSELKITERERERYCYILTYSFPCQDLSLAGKQKGMTKGSGTRSGLLWEVERLLDGLNGVLPQVLLMENVPQVIGKNNINDFQQWLKKLESLGYSNHIQILNAKDYGIPQNRKRCFMVSILGEYTYNFPKPVELQLKLKDMLEDNVDEKYYLSNEKIERIANWKAQQKPFENMIDNKKNVCQTLTARGAGEEHSGMVLVNESSYQPVGTIYAEASERFQRPPMKDLCKTLKAECHDTSVVEIKK